MSNTIENQPVEVDQQGLVSCPKCGPIGYYEKKVTAYDQYYNPDGTPDFHSDFGNVWGGRVKYCNQCHKKIPAANDKANRPDKKS